MNQVVQATELAAGAASSTALSPAPAGESDRRLSLKARLNRSLLPSASDREFLPAALEILETPPSPINVVLIWTICLLVAGALAWAWFGHLDIIAVAPGRIQPTGQVKVVQSPETGRVVEILVENGSEVAAGDPLVRLDPRDAKADVATARGKLGALVAEAQRRHAGLEAVESGEASPAAIVWSDEVAPQIRAREALVLKADLARLSADLAGVEAQKLQKEADISRLQAMIEAQRVLIAKEDVRVGMRTELLNLKAGSKAQLNDAEETRQVQRVNLAQQEGELTSANAEIAIAATTRKRTLDTFTAEYGQKLADAEREIDNTREALNKALVRLDHMTITAPIAGVVTALSAHGLGQVLSAGADVLRIVPKGSQLELEVFMPNSDIGFIKSGQPVTVKIESFPYTRYGGIEGTVSRIAKDAVSQTELQQSIAAPGSPQRSTTAAGSEAISGLVYPVTVALSQQSMAVDGEDVPLAAGMVAEAEIKTGQRRIIDYILSPLVETGADALTER